MTKKEFYKTFIGTDTQCLKTGGTIAVPTKISSKASIIIESLATASIGWDYSLSQLQEKVFDAREAKFSWDKCGTFKSADMLTVKDLKEAMAQVFYNCRSSEYWKDSMLMLCALKNGEFVVRKVEYIADFFKTPTKKEGAEKKGKSIKEMLEALLVTAEDEKDVKAIKAALDSYEPALQVINA